MLIAIGIILIKTTVMLVCIIHSVYQLIYRSIKHNSIFCYKNYFLTTTNKINN